MTSSMRPPAPQRAAGVPAPAALRASADGIVPQFVGDRTLVEQFRLDAATRLAASRRELSTIADVHGRDQYLSRAFARDMLEHDRGICLIDFVDDPLETMSLVQAQAPDWLAGLHSSIWLSAAFLCAWTSETKSTKGA